LDLFRSLGDGSNPVDTPSVEEDEGALFCNSPSCWDGVNSGTALSAKRINTHERFFYIYKYTKVALIIRTWYSVLEPDYKRGQYSQ